MKINTEYPVQCKNVGDYHFQDSGRFLIGLMLTPETENEKNLGDEPTHDKGHSYVCVCNAETCIYIAFSCFT